MRKDIFYRGLGIFIISVVIVLMIASLAGCNAGQKAVDKYKASSAFPRECADSFPIVNDTTFIAGQTITDTVIDYRYFDSSIQVITGTDTVYATIQVGQQTKTIYKYIRDTIRVSKTDTRIVEALGRQLQEADSACSTYVNQLKADKAKTDKRLSTRTKQRNIGCGIISLFGLYAFRHQLIGLLGGLPGFFIGLISKRRK